MVCVRIHVIGRVCQFGGVGCVCSNGIAIEGIAKVLVEQTY